MSRYESRVLVDSYRWEFSFLPMLGLIKKKFGPWRYRLCFGFGIWRLSIGFLRKWEQEADHG